MISRKIITLLLTAFIFGGFCFFPHISYSSSDPPSPAITAPSAVLIDANTGQILLAKNEHEKRSIASTTKIMTAILALEQAKLADEVTTSENATAAGGAEVYLSPGEKLTVEQLLYAILLRSANDACIAVAEHVAKSVESFVSLMNKKAKDLGARNTRFTNPHGLSDSNHYSTAFDLALIAKYALKNKRFAKIVATKSYILPWPGNPYNRFLKNHNKLLWRYPGATGIKTGYTREAGHCLVASAKRGNSHLISVVLGCPSGTNSFDDSIKLLDYGFTNWRPVRIVKKGKIYKKVNAPVWVDKKLNLVAEENLTIQVRQRAVIRKVFKVERGTSLPIRKGQKLGKILVFEKDKLLGTVSLVAERKIRQPSFWERIVLVIKSIFRG